MRQPDYSGQFKRDVKQAQKRGKDMSKFCACSSKASRCQRHTSTIR
jgi:mRNA-degrading endonuclease YafQ of YafQ-DinJ toxin-antitoxin module